MATLEEKLNHPRRPAAPPAEYAGQWVAWNKEQTEVLAHGKTLKEAAEAATAAGVSDALFMPVPRLNAFIG